MPNESKLMNRLCQGVIHSWKNNSYVIYCYPYPWWVWCLCSNFFLWQENIGTRGEQQPLWLIPSDIQIWPYVTGANNLWLSVVSLKTASIDHQQILVVLGKSPVNVFLNIQFCCIVNSTIFFADLLALLGSPPAEKGEVKDRRGSVQRAEAQLGWEGCPCLGKVSGSVFTGLPAIYGHWTGKMDEHRVSNYWMWWYLLYFQTKPSRYLGTTLGILYGIYELWFILTRCTIVRYPGGLDNVTINIWYIYLLAISWVITLKPYIRNFNKWANDDFGSWLLTSYHIIIYIILLYLDHGISWGNKHFGTMILLDHDDGWKMMGPMRPLQQNTFFFTWTSIKMEVDSWYWRGFYGWVNTQGWNFFFGLRSIAVLGGWVIYQQVGTRPPKMPRWSWSHTWSRGCHRGAKRTWSCNVNSRSSVAWCTRSSASRRVGGWIGWEDADVGGIHDDLWITSWLGRSTLHTWVG